MPNKMQVTNMSMSAMGHPQSSASASTQFFESFKTFAVRYEQMSEQLKDEVIRPPSSLPMILASNAGTLHGNSREETEIRAKWEENQRLCKTHASKMMNDTCQMKETLEKMRNAMETSPSLSMLINSAKCVLSENEYRIGRVEDYLGNYGYQPYQFLQPTSAVTPKEAPASNTQDQNEATGEMNKLSRKNSKAAVAVDELASQCQNKENLAKPNSNPAAILPQTQRGLTRPQMIEAGHEEEVKPHAPTEASPEHGQIKKFTSYPDEDQEFHTPNTPTMEEFGLSTAGIERAMRSARAIKYAAAFSPPPTTKRTPRAADKCKASAVTQMEIRDTPNIKDVPVQDELDKPFKAKLADDSGLDSDHDITETPETVFHGRTGKYYAFQKNGVSDDPCLDESTALGDKKQAGQIAEEEFSGKQTLSTPELYRVTDMLVSRVNKGLGLPVASEQDQKQAAKESPELPAVTENVPTVRVPGQRLSSFLRIQPEEYDELMSFVKSQANIETLNYALEYLYRNPRLHENDKWLKAEDIQEYMMQLDLSQISSIGKNANTNIPGKVKAILLALTKLNRIKYGRRDMDMGYVLL